MIESIWTDFDDKLPNFGELIFIKKRDGKIEKIITWVDSSPYDLKGYLWAYSKHIETLLRKFIMGKTNLDFSEIDKEASRDFIKPGEVVESTCPSCMGTGTKFFNSNSQTCIECLGEGYIRYEY